MLLWTTPVAGALFLFAYFMFPSFSPPMSPTLTPEEVAAFFRDHVASIRGVVILCLIISAALSFLVDWPYLSSDALAMRDSLAQRRLQRIKRSFVPRS
jgi:hypothetical protein